MTNRITVRDRAGNTVVRVDGVLMDGDSVQVSARIMDGAADDTLKLAAGILGSHDFNLHEEQLRRMSAADMRRAVVVLRVPEAAGKPASYIQGAWDHLAKSVRLPEFVVTTKDAAAAPAPVQYRDAKDAPGAYRDMCDALAASSGGFSRSRGPDGMAGSALAGHLDGSASAAHDAYVRGLGTAWQGRA